MKKTEIISPLILIAALLGGCTATGLGAGGAMVGAAFKEKGFKTSIRDEQIKLGIESRLLDWQTELYEDITVNVVEGRVLLTGTVGSREDKILASRAVWKTPDVVSLDDALEVRGDSGSGAWWRDLRISMDARGEVIAAIGARYINYNLTTVDRTVYVTGVAKDETELSLAIEAIRKTPDVRRVVSYVLTRDDRSR